MELLQRCKELNIKSTIGKKLSQEMIINEINYFSMKRGDPWLKKLGYHKRRILKSEIIHEMLLLSENHDHSWINDLEVKEEKE
jgi:hypothetical protein